MCFDTKKYFIKKFIQKSSQYVGIEALTPYVLHELVKAIYVDAPDKSSGKRRQHIHIQYDGLGFIPIDTVKYTPIQKSIFRLKVA